MPTPRHPTLLLSFLLLVALPVVATRADDDDDDGKGKTESVASRKRFLRGKREALFAAKKFDETGFERLKDPVEGEWLYHFDEDAQDRDAYRKDCANKRRAGRETIYLRPLGPLSPRARAAVEPIRRFTEAFFTLTVEVQAERELPKKAFVAKRKQYDEGPIMADLKKECPDDGLILAGLADEDLFSDDLNFVFGVGSLQDRVGLYSLHRFTAGPGKEDRVYRRRAFQLVAHELGHILSLEHCVFYKCVMNGSNSLEESDEQPCHACPVCLAKLEWNLGQGGKGKFDRAARTRALIEVFKAEGMDEEAKWSEARLGEKQGLR